MLVSTAVHVEGPINTHVTSIEGTRYESSMITNLTMEMTQILHGQLVRLNPGESETYKPPRTKTLLIAIFWVVFLWSRQMYGMGRISNAQSVMMLGTALPMKNWLTSTPQCGFRDLSQKPRMGRHWKIVVKICVGPLGKAKLKIWSDVRLPTPSRLPERI